jgi:hypothetical protein
LLLPCHRPQRMISNFEAWKERLPAELNWDKKDVEVSLVQFKGIVRFIHECQQNAEVDFERVSDLTHPKYFKIYLRSLKMRP